MKVRFIIIIFLLIVVSVIITLNLFFHRSYAAEMASQINQQQLIIVKTLSYSIDDMLDHFKEEATSLTRLLSRRGLKMEGLREFIWNSFEELNEDIKTDVVIIGEGGRTIFSSDNEYLLANEDVTLVAEAGNLHTGEYLMKFSALPLRKIKIASPIFKGGTNIGFVMIIIDVDDLTKKFLEPIKIGPRGHAWVMDQDGTLLFHPTMPEMVGKNIRRQTEDCFRCHKSFNAENNILQTRSIGYSSYIAPYGEDKLIAFSRIEMLDWVVCLSTPYSEVTMSIKNSMRLQSMLVLAILFSTVFVAFIIIIINRERVKAETRAQYADKVREYADELEVIVKERTSQLRSEKEKLDALVGSINAAICTFGPDNKCRWMNQVLKEWLGEERCESFSLDVVYDKLNDSERIWSAVVRDRLVQEIAHLDLGAKKGYFQISFTPIHLPDGSLELLMLMQDVTELKMAEEQMIQSDKLAALSRLSAGVAHEIGNPLTSISSYVQILKDMEFDEFTSNALKTIYRHITRIEAILRKMSSFTRAKEDEFKSFNVRELVNNTVDLVRYDKRTKGIEIKVDIPEDTPEVKVNGNQMIQIIMNLVLNAADAMPEGGVMDIFTKVTGRELEIHFRDTGSGIAAEHMGRIFDPFYTTKNTGTGLGLAVSISIIKSFGGQIEALNNPEGGATFIVRLPINEK